MLNVRPEGGTKTTAMLSHVFLHVALCAAMLHQAPDAAMTLHVRLLYPQGISHPIGVQLDQSYAFKRETDPETVVEFDVPAGTYEMQLDAPKYGCSAREFLAILPEHNRTVSERLLPGIATVTPVLLLQGAAPPAFQSVKPTFVLFGNGATCDKPIPATLRSHIAVENDIDGYYVWMYMDEIPDASNAPLVLAARIATPTGLFHYVRLRVPFPQTFGGWPSTIRFNITEDMIDGLATEKTDTLLCPKLWQTSAG